MFPQITQYSSVKPYPTKYGIGGILAPKWMALAFDNGSQ